MSAPRLITRADDAGTFASANRAILETCRDGICRNVSLMAPCPAIADAAAVLAGCEDICFGLHATITCEWAQPRWGPCADPAAVPALLHEDGGMVPAPVDVHERGAPVEQVLTELDAQLERLHGLGFRISYLDTHMPWEWIHPPGREDDRIQAHLQEWAAAKGLLYWLQWGDAVGRLSKAGEQSGVAGFVENLRAMPEDVTQMVFQHPAYDDEEMATVQRWGKPELTVGADRDQQRRCFVDPAVLEAVRERGIVPIRYDEV